MYGKTQYFNGARIFEMSWVNLYNHALKRGQRTNNWARHLKNMGGHKKNITSQHQHCKNKKERKTLRGRWIFHCYVECTA